MAWAAGRGGGGGGGGWLWGGAGDRDPGRLPGQRRWPGQNGSEKQSEVIGCDKYYLNLMKLPS